MENNELLSQNIVAKEVRNVKAKNPAVKVTVHVPDRVSENVRRKKINRIFDLLTADVSK